MLHHFERLGDEIGFRHNFVRKKVETLRKKALVEAAVLQDKLNLDSKTASPVYDEILKTIAKHSQL